jgi:hypothetical protein
MTYQMTKHSFISFLASCLLSATCYAIDIGNESTADKADRFDFEEFHKDKGITLWEEKKAEEKKEKTGSEKTSTADKSVNADKTFKKGETLKLREAYKLGSDPGQRTVQSLFDATEALHKQLNARCPNGWVKEQEWHKPEAGYFYIHYQASCL